MFTTLNQPNRLIYAEQTLTDLNDFLTPSQVCIKPVEQENEPEVSKEPGGATVCSRPSVMMIRLTYYFQTEIVIDSTGSYYEVPANGNASAKNAERKLQQAQISLNDCLACRSVVLPYLSAIASLR